MNSVVVVPVFNRPELLAIALKRLMLASSGSETGFLFQADLGADSYRNSAVIESYGPASYDTRVASRACDGNTLNILEGLKHGLEWAENVGASWVHLLEDDIWVARDYFDAAEKIHRKFHPWAVSLCRNQHRSFDPPPDASAVYRSSDYQSLAVSFPLDSVREILTHNTSEYFDDMPGYLRTMFPRSRFGSLFTEQDGLCTRLVEKNGYDVFYVNVPRAFHAGYYSPGYHRAGRQPEGTLDERIAQLESMTEADMNERSTYRDIKFADLDGFQVEEFFEE